MKKLKESTQKIKLEVTDEDVKEFILEVQGNQQVIDDLSNFIFKFTSKYKLWKSSQKYQWTLFWK